jgi:hypothetical protein
VPTNRRIFASARVGAITGFQHGLRCIYRCRCACFSPDEARLPPDCPAYRRPRRLVGVNTPTVLRQALRVLEGQPWAQLESTTLERHLLGKETCSIVPPILQRPPGNAREGKTDSPAGPPVHPTPSSFTQKSVQTQKDALLINSHPTQESNSIISGIYGFMLKAHSLGTVPSFLMKKTCT